MSQEPAETKGGIPQDVANDLSVLAEEVRQLAQSSARRWKTTLVAFIIILGVIFSYLTFWVYPAFIKELTTPEVLVEMGMEAVNTALGSFGAPTLESGQLPDWAANELEKAAPMVMQTYVKPQIEDLKQRVAELRVEYTAKIKEEIPGMIDQAMEDLSTKYLPELRQRVIGELGGLLDRLLTEADQALGELVQKVIAEHAADIREMQNEELLRALLEATFEEHLGPYVDQYIFQVLDPYIAKAAEELETLANTDVRNMTYEQKLDMRIVQLVVALFEKVGENLPESLLPVGTRAPALEQAPPPPAGVPSVPIEAKKLELEQLKQTLAGLPPQATAEARQALQEQIKRLEAEIAAQKQ